MLSQRVVMAAALLAAVLTTQAHTADRRVPSQYPTIAAALAVAGPGDRVVVAPGNYQENDLDLPAGITLLGTPSAPASVVIDAGGRGRVLRAENLDLTVTIAGLTLIGGHARGDTPYDASGGGLLVSRAEVRLEDVILVGNTADGSGGGLRVCHGNVVLLRCAARGNIAGDGGGGMDVSYDSIANGLEVAFTDNQAAWGGAVSLRTGSSSVIFESQFLRNRAEGQPGMGGALACDLGAAPALKLCVLANNEARYGGAVYAGAGVEPFLAQTTIDRNEASSAGAAFYLRDAYPTLDRTIVSFHPQQAFVCRSGAQPELSKSDVYGNNGGDWVGTLSGQRTLRDNFRADPLYCAVDDRSLRADSPCAPGYSGMGVVGAVGVGCGITTDIPSALQSAQLGAQPNPFNPITEVVYTLPIPGHARVSVYDIRGRLLRVLVDETRPAGENRVRWEARDTTGRSLASGTYLLVLETGGQRLTSKLMLVR